METANLRSDTYCQMIDALAETVYLLTDSLDFETRIDEMDSMIRATKLIETRPALIMALSPHSSAFWDEYTTDEVDDLLEEMGGEGDLLRLMAYYAMQADVEAGINLHINSLDTHELIVYTE